MTDGLPPATAAYFDEERETMSRARLEELQTEALLETIALAYERGALVRETWDAVGLRPADVRTLDDFREKVPYIDKDAVRAYRDRTGDPFGGLLCCEPSELTALLSTSGTTGDPTIVPERWGADPHAVRAILYRDLWGMGVRPGDHIALCLFTFRGPIYAFAHQLGLTPILLDHDPREIERLLRLSQELRPTALYNFGGTLIRATEEIAARAGIDPVDAFASYRGVVWAGEPLGARARRLAGEWGIELFEHTAVGDVTAAFECPAHDGMHTWEDTVFVEEIDPDDGTILEADRARGELVATALANRVAPLVRFRSDDLVRVTRQPCTCGRTHARLWTLGRRGDEVVVAGRAVLPVDVWDAVESVEACRLGLFQVLRPQREVDRLVLRVGYGPAAARRLAPVRDEVAAAVSAAIGIEPEVDLVPDEHLLALGPPHKIPRVARR